MNSPRIVTLALSSHADWDATVATVTGLDAAGDIFRENLLIPNGGNTTVTGVRHFASVTSRYIPAQSGTGGTATLGFGSLLDTLHGPRPPRRRALRRHARARGPPRPLRPQGPRLRHERDPLHRRRPGVRVLRRDRRRGRGPRPQRPAEMSVIAVLVTLRAVPDLGVLRPHHRGDGRRRVPAGARRGE